MRIDMASSVQALLGRMTTRTPAKVSPQADIAAQLPAAAAPSATPLQSVASVVVAAACAPEAARRREALRSAAKKLDLLAALHRESMAGVIRSERLSELWRSITQGQAQDDPALADFLAEVELRILVELARHDRV